MSQLNGASKTTRILSVVAAVFVIVAGAVTVAGLKRYDKIAGLSSQAGWYDFSMSEGWECDVFPRDGGDGVITHDDVDLISWFSVGTETPEPGSEFQRADCGPRPLGDGRITVADIVQAGRYMHGLDKLQLAGGPDGTNTSPLAYEGDVAPRATGGDGQVTMEDYYLAGQFSAGNQIPSTGLEFQKADTAPKETGGDGQITVADWVQTGRYAQGLDSLRPASGPTAPQQVQYECDVYPQLTGGDGKVTSEDYNLVGQFSVRNETPKPGLEFQKADAAPRTYGGDGYITVADWVQCGRYAQGIDPLQPATGPTSPR